MPMTQADIRRHYEPFWKTKSDQATEPAGLGYSSAVEDAVMYPVYEELIADLKIRVNGGKVLDVGSGSGRWVRYFLERYQPSILVGIDYAQSSIDLLDKWCTSTARTRLAFHQADVTDPQFTLDEAFDLINVANVLFHIPETDLYVQAMRNLARLVAPDGRIVTTEYMPRASMRTEWMLVRSRYEFQKIVEAAGLRIVAVRAFSFFSNDPMGIDGPDDGVRLGFNKVRAMNKQILEAHADSQGRDFVVALLAEVERAAIAFCRERLADVDLPSQKLVALAPATS